MGTVGTMRWGCGKVARAGALVIGSVAALGGASVAHAETSCAPVGPDGSQQCTAGIRSDTVEATVATAGGQRMSQWCWAASISMVFRYYGYEVSQQRIVAETFGQVVNMPGTAEQIMAQLGREWTDDRGRPFRVQASFVSQAGAAEELAADRPLMVGTLGHAMVLTALGYVQSPYAGAQVTSAVVRDPWPGRGRRELLADEWNGADMLLAIHVAGAPNAAPPRTQPAPNPPAFEPPAFELPTTAAPTAEAPAWEDSDDAPGEADWSALWTMLARWQAPELNPR